MFQESESVRRKHKPWGACWGILYMYPTLKCSWVERPPGRRQKSQLLNKLLKSYWKIQSSMKAITLQNKNWLIYISGRYFHTHPSPRLLQKKVLGPSLTAKPGGI